MRPAPMMSGSHDTTFQSIMKIDADICKDLYSNIVKKTCKRPDGNIITFGSKRFRCPKVLFQPNIIGKEASGINDTTPSLS